MDSQRLVTWICMMIRTTAHRASLNSLNNLKQLQDRDLIIGADGLNSTVREASGFLFEIDLLSNFFAWYGTRKTFSTLTQTFRNSPWGPFNAHHYRYSPEMSTFIIETDRETWEQSGFSRKSEMELLLRKRDTEQSLR